MHRRVVEALQVQALENPKRLAASLTRIPAGRLGTPGDMAGVALFLASPLAAYVYGQTIPVGDDQEIASFDVTPDSLLGPDEDPVEVSFDFTDGE